MGQDTRVEKLAPSSFGGLIDKISKEIAKESRGEKPPLEIVPGGKLIQWKWNSETRKHVSRDVTKTAARYLFDYCEVRRGVVLRDLFLLINTNLKVFDSVLANWCLEFTREILAVRRAPKNRKLAYLELYKYLGVEEKKVWGTDRPDFHAVGFPLRKSQRRYKAGERINYSLSATSLEEIVFLPLRLNRLMRIVNHDVGVPEFHQTLAELPNAQYTLGDILHGVLWELSYHGGPKQRIQFAEELFGIAERAGVKKSRRREK